MELTYRDFERARRARRRRDTARIAQQRLSDWAALCGPAYLHHKYKGSYFAKQSCGCSCSKRKHGQPRVCSGTCCWNHRERIYLWRQESRRINNLVSIQWADPMGDEVNILTHPNQGRTRLR